MTNEIVQCSLTPDTHLFSFFERLEAPTIWLLAAEAQGVDTLLQTAGRQAEQEGHLSVSLRVRGRRAHAFLGLKQLLAVLETPLRQEKPDLLHSYGGEWVTLFPEAGQDPVFQHVRALDELALPASERRLSRESEQVFRIINRGVTLILDALDHCPSLQNRTLWIWAPHFEDADRLTGHVLHHLHRRTHPRVRMVLALPQLPGEVPSVDSLPSHHADTHSSLLDAHREALRFLNHLHHDMEPLVIIPTQALSDLPVEQQVASDWSEEERWSHLAVQAFQAECWEEGQRALEEAILLSIHWGNYEHVLALVAEGLRAAQRASFSHSVQIRLWKWCGLIHAYLGNFAEAMTAYQQALTLASEPPMRAQLYAYLALLATKRLDDQEEAARLLDVGLNEIEGREDESSLIERAWLYNIQALSFFSRRQYRVALSLCRQAHDLIKTLHSGEVLHLKINLVSNMSIVLEEMGNINGALKAWHVFRQFLQHGSGLFQKVYYYREAGLLLKLGENDRSIEVLMHAYREAEATHDAFHMDFIARDIGALFYHQQRWTEAGQWFMQSEEAARKVGGAARVQGALLAQALTYWQAGQDAEARLLLLNLLQTTPPAADQRHLYEDLLLAWQKEREAGRWAELAQEAVRTAIGWPKTKLGRPFYPIHVPAGHVVKE